MLMTTRTSVLPDFSVPCQSPAMFWALRTPPTSIATTVGFIIDHLSNTCPPSLEPQAALPTLYLRSNTSRERRSVYPLQPGIHEAASILSLPPRGFRDSQASTR